MAVNNSLATQNKKTGITSYLTRMDVKQQIDSVVKDSKTFITSVVSAVSTNPALSECTNTSILSAALLGESLQLPPSPQLGMYYMVPFKDKKTGATNAQFQISYRGMIQLAIRSGQYKRLNVLAIKEGELVKYDPLEETIEVNLIQDDVKREQTKTAGYYAFFEYTNGFKKSLYWSKDKMLAHADRYSQAFSLNATNGKYPKVSYADFLQGKYPEKDAWLYSSFWYKDFDGMACKTMLRQLISHWGVMSVEMQKAIEFDQSVVHGTTELTPEYVDVIDTTNEVPSAPVSEPVVESTATEAPAQDVYAALFG